MVTAADDGATRSMSSISSFIAGSAPTSPCQEAGASLRAAVAGSTSTSVSPMWSWVCSGTSASNKRTAPSQVPLVLAWSSTRKRFPRRVMRRCFPEMNRSSSTRSLPESLPIVAPSPTSRCTDSVPAFRSRIWAACQRSEPPSARGWATVPRTSVSGASSPLVACARKMARHCPSAISVPSVSCARGARVPPTTVPFPERSSTPAVSPERTTAACCLLTSGSGMTTSHRSPRPRTILGRSSEKRSTSSPRRKNTSSGIRRPPRT